jgi:hypothetical protein
MAGSNLKPAMMVPGRQKRFLQKRSDTWSSRSFASERHIEDIFETKALLGRSSMEDADYLHLFQRYLNESGGMLRRGGLERRDTTGERLPC